MKTSSIQMHARAKVYAEVLLQAAKDAGNVLAVEAELDELLSAVRNSVNLRNALNDKALSVDSKKAIIRDVFVDFKPEVLSVFEVMVERNDLAALARTNETYTDLAEKELGATIIDVTTVIPLDDSLREKIIAKYSAEFGTDVLLREHIDSSIVGGIVLSTHGKRIDASVSAQLENARHTLSKS